MSSEIRDRLKLSCGHIVKDVSKRNDGKHYCLACDERLRIVTRFKRTYGELVPDTTLRVVK